MIKIGFDARPLVGKRTGVGNYVWYLLNELAKLMPEVEFIAYSPEGFLPNLPETMRNYQLRSSKAYPFMSGYFWLKWQALSLIKQDEIDLFWAPRTLYPNGLEKYVPVISTVHDINHLICPNTMNFSSLIAHKLYFKHDSLNATRIITNSFGTASRIYEWLDRKVDAIIVPGVSNEFYPREDTMVSAVCVKYKIYSPYILFVGTLEPRKNLSLLLESFRQLKSFGYRNFKLVLVGQRGWRNHKLEQDLDQGIDGVIEIGYVSNDDLAALYSGAELFVFPSLYEGYGMPVAEAKACGTKIVATDIPELREAGGDRGIYVNPLSVDTLTKGIVKGLQMDKSSSEIIEWSQGAVIMSHIFYSTLSMNIGT